MITFSKNVVDWKFLLLKRQTYPWKTAILLVWLCNTTHMSTADATYTYVCVFIVSAQTSNIDDAMRHHVRKKSGASGFAARTPFLGTAPRRRGGVYSIKQIHSVFKDIPLIFSWQISLSSEVKMQMSALLASLEPFLWPFIYFFRFASRIHWEKVIYHPVLNRAPNSNSACLSIS